MKGLAIMCMPQCTRALKKCTLISQVSWRKREKKINNKLMNLQNRLNFFKVHLCVCGVDSFVPPNEALTDLITEMVWTGQLQQLQEEIGVLREQIDVSSSSHDELQTARDEAKALKRALETAAAERDRDVAAIQTNLSTASKDLDKWRQTANKYEREIDNLQRDLQQQSMQWQKTAEIQGMMWCKYVQSNQNIMMLAFKNDNDFILVNKGIFSLITHLN